jgi:hypothetical protein
MKLLIVPMMLILDHLAIQRMDTSGRNVQSKGPKNDASKAIPFDKNEPIKM